MNLAIVPVVPTEQGFDAGCGLAHGIGAGEHGQIAAGVCEPFVGVGFRVQIIRQFLNRAARRSQEHVISGAFVDAVEATNVFHLLRQFVNGTHDREGYQRCSD